MAEQRKPRSGPEAQRAIEAEGRLPHTVHDREITRALELGLPGADSIVDKTIPTFSRGELPHFAGINTFLKAPYVEDVRQCGNYDVAIVGAPFDGGTTYRSGARFSPQGMRKISALFGPYNFELGVDLRESITMCDLGDIFVIPGNIEKTFDQVSKAVGHIYASGALPVVLGGDHSLGFPTIRGVAQHLNGGKLGILHFDRHVDTQDTDLDERMHTSYGKNIRTCLSNNTYLLKARRQLRQMRHHGPFGLMTDKPSSIAVSQSLWSAHTK